METFDAVVDSVRTDGKVVLGGWANDTTTTGNFTVLRLTEAGQPDSSFDGDSIVITPLAPSGKNAHARAPALRPDGRIPATRILLAGPMPDVNMDNSYFGAEVRLMHRA